MAHIFDRGNRRNFTHHLHHHLKQVYTQGIKDGYTAGFYNERTEPHRSQTETPIFRETAQSAVEAAETWATENVDPMFERFQQDGDPEWMPNFLLDGEPWNVKLPELSDGGSEEVLRTEAC